MSSLTKKFFENLSTKQQNVEINEELLGYFGDFSDLTEYQDLADLSVTDPVVRTEKLKRLIFKLYEIHKLKDVDFFKYLVWSDQGKLCKLIGYGDKQIDKWKNEKPTRAGGDKMETDGSFHQSDASAAITRFQSGVHEMETDMPINKNNVPAATTHAATTQTTPPAEAYKPVVPTYIVYSKEDSDVVLELSDFLRYHCGVSCDIDQYHIHENILQWGVWNENKIKECAGSNGFVLLICSPVMYQQLSRQDSSQIQMKPSFIDTPTLNNLITGSATSDCIIPVCLEELNKEIVPISLHAKHIYSLSFSKVDPKIDLRFILDTPGLEDLRSLVYILRGEREIYMPPIGPKQ